MTASSRQAGIIALLLLGFAASAQASPGWAPPVSPSGPSTVSHSSKVTIDTGGQATVRWSTYDGTHGSVMSSTRPPGGTWGAPVTLFPGYEVATIASNHAGVSVALLQQGNAIQASVLRGDTWSAPVTIYTIDPYPTRLGGSDLVVEPDGSATVVWDNGALKTMHMNPAGEWEHPAKVLDSGEATDALPVSLGVSDEGTVNVTFERGISPVNRAYVVSRTPAGVWGAPVPISPPAEEYVLKATSATSPSGSLTVVWETLDPYKVWARTRPRPDLPFQAPVVVSGLVDRLDVDGGLSVSVNRAGDAIVGWSGENDFAAHTWNVQTATKMHDGQWQAAKTIAVAGTRGVSPNLLMFENGSSMAAWTDYEAGPDILVQAAVNHGSGAWEKPTQISPSGHYSSVDSLEQDGHGNAVLSWMQDAGNTNLGQIFTSMYDVTSPVLYRTSLPQSGFTGVPVAFVASAFDAWSTVTTPVWDFGDTRQVTGATVDHTFYYAATYGLTVTTADAGGLTATEKANITIVRTAVQALTITPRSFKASKRRPAQVSYALNVGVPVTFTIERRSTGRKKTFGPCEKQTRRNKRRRPCARWTRLRGSFKSTDAAITSSAPRLTGYLSGHKLTPGRYRLRATPKAGGITGTSRVANFTVRRY